MYRIGYLTPAPGAEGPLALQAAAAAMGHELTPIEPGQLAENSPFDFVISTLPRVRKTTSHPLFVADHQPRAAYFEARGGFDALASYDGYLAIAGNLRRFFAGVAAALDKTLTEPGHFYPVAQPVGAPAEVAALAGRGALKLCCLDSGSDPQAGRLLRRLQARPDVAVTAPSHSLEARQAAYRDAGAGLVLASQERLLDDVAADSLFEIVAAGACAVCPDTPWTRQQFGESLFYYRPFGSADEVSADIDAALAAIAADPKGAAARAAEALRILAEHFGLGPMLAAAVDYYDRWRAAEATALQALGEPAVDVIMRVGGRPAEVVARAVASVERQKAGRFRLILVAYQPIDLAAVTGRSYSRIAEIVTVEAFGGNRGRTLVAGLDAVRSPYFCVLDDDDYWLAGHVAGLLRAIGGSADALRFAYSDVLRLDETGEPRRGPLDNGVSPLQSGPAHGDVFALLSRLPSHCFLADSAGLAQIRFRHWDMATAEDGLLIAALLRRATPRHSPNATAVYCQGRAGASAFLKDRQRSEDELALFTEVAAWRPEIEARFPSRLPDRAGVIGPLARAVMEARRKLILGAAASALVSEWIALEPDEADSLDTAAWGEDVYGGAFADEPMVFLPLSLDSGRAAGQAVTVAKDGGAPVARARASQPWEVALRIDISDYGVEGCSTMAVAAIDRADQPLSLGLTDGSGEPAARVQLPPGSGVLAVGVSGPPGRPLQSVILQGGPDAPTQPLAVRGVKVGYRLSELRDALAGGDPAVPRGVLLERLQAKVMNQVLGGPPAGCGSGEPISFRTPACTFRRILRDGPFSEGAPRVFTSGSAPWDYFAQIHVPGAGPDAGARWLHIVVRDTAEPFHAFLVDERFETSLSAPVAVTAGKAQVDIWLQAPGGGAGAYVVFQCGAAPQDLPMTLERVEVVA
jgi:hypothetical protein